MRSKECPENDVFCVFVHHLASSGIQARIF
jgi:hypothetical protein